MGPLPHPAQFQVMVCAVPWWSAGIVRTVAPAPNVERKVEIGPGIHYLVQTPVFEGPFDLLLHLITKEQVDLYEVSLSSIVDGYLAEVEQMGRMDLDVATEFLLIAATLIELKARRLLPGRDDVDIDEELWLLEERDLLLSRLLECKTFKDAAAALQRLMANADRSLPRLAGLEERFLEVMPDLLEGVSAGDVKDAFVRAVTPKPVPKVDLEHVAPIRISVRDAVEELVHELPRLRRITFRRLTGHLVDRLEVIVHFLAVLELYKQGAVDLHQASTFGQLDVEWLGADRDVLEQLDTYDG
jgi:segregation and condensation protein A